MSGLKSRADTDLGLVDNGSSFPSQFLSCLAWSSRLLLRSCTDFRNVLGPGELAINSDGKNFQLVLFCQFGTTKEQVTFFWIPLSRDGHGLAF